jgi:hypothetical protein
MGAIVSKDELMARLWPGRIVEEGNLHVNVSALRKSLDKYGEGHGLVVTVPDRGYRLADLPGLPSAQMAEGSLPPQLPLPDKPSNAMLPSRTCRATRSRNTLPTAWSRRDHRAFPHPLVVRDRAQFEAHLQGPSRVVTMLSAFACDYLTM